MRRTHCAKAASGPRHTAANLFKGLYEELLPVERCQQKGQAHTQRTTPGDPHPATEQRSQRWVRGSTTVCEQHEGDSPAQWWGHLHWNIGGGCCTHPAQMSPSNVANAFTRSSHAAVCNLGSYVGSTYGLSRAGMSVTPGNGQSAAIGRGLGPKRTGIPSSPNTFAGGSGEEGLLAGGLPAKEGSGE